MTWVSRLPMLDLEVGTPVVRVEASLPQPPGLDLPEFTHGVVAERVMLSEAVPQGEYDLWLPDERELVTVSRDLVRVDLDTDIGFGVALRELQRAAKAAGSVLVQDMNVLVSPLALALATKHLAGTVTDEDRRALARRLAHLVRRRSA